LGNAALETTTSGVREVQPNPFGVEERVSSAEAGWLVGWLVGEVNKQNLMWEYMYGIQNVGETFCEGKDVELHSLFFWG